MTKRNLIILLFLVHFALLSTIGFSWFGTTILFYYILFLACTSIFSLIIKEESIKNLVRKNLGVLFVFVVIIEFLMLFVFTRLNNYTENERGIYLSEYKKTTHTKILNYFGQNKKTFSYKNAYYPNSNRIVKKTEFENNHYYNKEGFRGKFPKIEKDSNEYRIILLGDSFIEGEGSDELNTISYLLEKKLNSISKSIKYSVLNGGICGSNPIYEKALFYKKLIKYKPDLVINNFFVNDIFDVQVMEKNNNLPLSEYPFAASHIYRFLDLVVLKNKNEQEFSILKGKIKIKNLNTLIKIHNSNEMLKDSLKNIGIMFLNTSIPSKAQVKSSYMNYNNLLIFDINFLDIWKKGKKTPTELIQNLYWKKDGHLRPEGNENIAEILKNKIININARTH